MPSNLTLFLPVYYKELVDNFDINVNIKYIKIFKKIPACYDKKKSSIKNICSDFLFLYIYSKKYKLIAPCHGLIDRIIFKKIISINNPYLDYYIFLDKYFSKIHPFNTPLYILKPQSTINVFPVSSRIEKNIPIIIAKQLISLSNVDCKIYLFINDQYYLSSDLIEYSKFNNFQELVSIVKSSSKIVTCDSLVLHLAIYFGVSVFCIATQKNSIKWFPVNITSSCNYFLSNNFNNNKLLAEIKEWIKQ